MRLTSTILFLSAAASLAACGATPEAQDASAVRARDERLLRAHLAAKPHASELADVDGDGHLDAVLAVGGKGDARLEVYTVAEGRVERRYSFPFPPGDLLVGTLPSGEMRTFRDPTCEETKGLTCKHIGVTDYWRIVGGQLVRQRSELDPQPDICEPAESYVPRPCDHADQGGSISAIRGIELAKERYDSACGNRTPGPGTGADNDWTLAVDEVVFGDLTGDGAEEAVVVLTCTTGGSAGPQPEAHVLSLRGGQLVRLHKVRGGDKHLGREARTFRIEAGQLHVARTWQSGNAMAMEEESETLRWDGAAFVRAAYSPRHRVAAP